MRGVILRAAALLVVLMVGAVAGPDGVGAQSEVHNIESGLGLDNQAGKLRLCIIAGTWDTEMTQSRIARYIASHYGYRLQSCRGQSSPLYAVIDRISNGSNLVSMEFWLGNAGPDVEDAWIEAIQRGELHSPGSSIKPNWQSAFVIPKYLQEQYPELDSVEDLEDEKYKALFATSETRGKARLMSCPVGWRCEQVNAEQVKGYGLSDHIEIVNPEGQAELLADLEGAYNRQEPWLGYTWATSDSNLLLDLVRLKEPTYSDKCWATTKACAYEDTTVQIAVSYSLQETAPDFMDVLRKWDFDIDRVYKPIFRCKATNPDTDAVVWWLKNNADIWKNWVTEDAATAIQSSLNADPTAKDACKTSYSDSDRAFTATPTLSPTATATPTFIPTHTPTPVGGIAPTSTATVTFTPTATGTHTPTPTQTMTPTPLQMITPVIGNEQTVPEIRGIASWINSEPLTFEEQRGKVILVEFWTYTCVNCIRTLPYLKAWHEKYADKGLVIVGVHTPEFEFEKDRDNVIEATEGFGLEYPIAQDNDFKTWRAFNNRYWPAKYLVDKDGLIRYTHFGEGAYDATELWIRGLLEEAGADLNSNVIQSPTSTVTLTATPTETPKPTETPTPIATLTPTAMPVPTATATHTAIPTDTPAPTSTPEPTATAVPPTQTPVIVVVTATPSADALSGGGCNSVGGVPVGVGAANLLLMVGPLGIIGGVRWGRRLQFRQGVKAHDSDKSKTRTLHRLRPS